MFSKNLRYYRLKMSLSKKELAQKCGISSMAITHYENGTRNPDMAILKSLAAALWVRVSDFLTVRNQNLSFQHGEFRKKSNLRKNQQEFIRESVEDYFGRFFTIVELLGGEVLPNAPECHALPLSGDAEKNALALRRHLGLADDGPIDDLVAVLENKGILVYVIDIENGDFSGMNGFVEGRPYIAINGTMTPERNRSTILHELAHLMFCWPENGQERENEEMATAISGAVLFSQRDAVRELGVHRSSIGSDMSLVCREYGISMMLLAKRAHIVGVISDAAYKRFCIWATKMGWRTNEPSRIEMGIPRLFQQLVYRAVNEGDISIQRAAELLHQSYQEVSSKCNLAEVS